LVFSIPDILEFGSFLAMLYASALAVWIAAKASGLRRAYAGLMGLLAMMLGLHASHHLFTLIRYESLDVAFELCSAISALIFVSAYVYEWGKM